MYRTCRHIKPNGHRCPPPALKASQSCFDHSTAHGSRSTNCDPRTSGSQLLCNLIFVAKWTETKLLTGNSVSQRTENKAVLCKDDINVIFRRTPPLPYSPTGDGRRPTGYWLSAVGYSLLAIGCPSIGLLENRLCACEANFSESCERVTRKNPKGAQFLRSCATNFNLAENRQLADLPTCQLADSFIRFSVTSTAKLCHNYLLKIASDLTGSTRCAISRGDLPCQEHM